MLEQLPPAQCAILFFFSWSLSWWYACMLVRRDLLKTFSSDEACRGRPIKTMWGGWRGEKKIQPLDPSKDAPRAAVERECCAALWSGQPMASAPPRACMLASLVQRAGLNSPVGAIGPEKAAAGGARGGGNSVPEQPRLQAGGEAREREMEVEISFRYTVLFRTCHPVETRWIRDHSGRKCNFLCPHPLTRERERGKRIFDMRTWRCRARECKQPLPCGLSQTCVRLQASERACPSAARPAAAQSEERPPIFA